jgi:protein gp37
VGETTQIEWADGTFNGWWGCARVSPACQNCYAETFDRRLGGSHWGVGRPRRVFGDEHWAQPLKWNAKAAASGVRRRIFCSSMSDIFDAEAPPGALARLWNLIRETPNLDWLLLTKRPERIAASLPADWGNGWPNVWLGTTVENQKYADLRLPQLLAIPAVVHFISAEPLLGPLELRRFLQPAEWSSPRFSARATRLTWVIGGGETGARARPLQLEWIRGLRDQCVESGTPFHFKQWGDHGPGADGLARLGKKRAGRELDGRTWDQLPVLRSVAPSAAGRPFEQATP